MVSSVSEDVEQLELTSTAGRNGPITTLGKCLAVSAGVSIFTAHRPAIPSQQHAQTKDVHPSHQKTRMHHKVQYGTAHNSPRGKQPNGSSVDK